MILSACTTSAKQLSFVAQSQNGIFGFYCLAKSGSEPGLVATLSGDLVYKEWAADGKRLIAQNPGDRAAYLVMLEDARNPFCLSCKLEEYRSAHFSPSGRWLLIWTLESLYTWETDHFEKVNDIEARLTEGVWSPDEKELIFVQLSEALDRPDIYRLTLETGAITRITAEYDYAGYYGLAWSPDGQRIAASATDRDNITHLVMLDHNGANLTRLVEQKLTRNVETFEQVVASWSDLSWSPDGQKIAFSSAVTPDNRDIFVIDIAGAHVIDISNQPGADMNPAWSPDGKWLVFVSKNTDGTSDVLLTQPDGSNLRNISGLQGKNDDPAWSLDGQYITFVSDQDGNSEVYQIDLNGNKPVNISHNPASQDFDPSWRACPANK
jgi:TolB protein